jgi:hypothetical protein
MFPPHAPGRWPLLDLFALRFLDLFQGAGFPDRSAAMFVPDTGRGLVPETFPGWPVMLTEAPSPASSSSTAPADVGEWPCGCVRRPSVGRTGASSTASGCSPTVGHSQGRPLCEAPPPQGPHPSRRRGSPTAALGAPGGAPPSRGGSAPNGAAHAPFARGRRAQRASRVPHGSTAGPCPWCPRGLTSEKHQRDAASTCSRLACQAGHGVRTIALQIPRKGANTSR